MLDKFGMAGPALAPLSPWQTIQVPVSMLLPLSAETTSAANKDAVKLPNLNSASKKPSSSIYSALKEHDSRIKFYTTLEYIYMFSAYMIWRQQGLLFAAYQVLWRSQLNTLFTRISNFHFILHSVGHNPTVAFEFIFCINHARDFDPYVFCSN